MIFGWGIFWIFIVFGFSFTFWTIVGIVRFLSEAVESGLREGIVRLRALSRSERIRIVLDPLSVSFDPSAIEFREQARLPERRSWLSRMKGTNLHDPEAQDFVVSLDLDRVPLQAIRLERDGQKLIADISEVAVLVPAHNEEAVIADALTALKAIIPVSQIFIANDASSDRTGEIARNFGCNVYDILPNRGKAGALAATLEHFRIYERFRFALFVDADTRLRGDYLIRALPYFSDPGVAAVAGFARTQWKDNPYIAYRERVWFVTQIFLRFGMCWRYTNVNMIVPGFASMYRTDVLRQIDIAKSGMVIEDYNMTFEIHRKKLGRIVSHPSITGFTQDPDTFEEYCRQVKRWNLGFWQTIRVNGFWPSFFWANLSIYLAELVLSSLVLLALPFVLMAASALMLTGYIPPDIFGLVLYQVGIILVIDYAVTIFVAIVEKRQRFLFYGLTMIIFRVIDAWYFLRVIPLAFKTHSTGQWLSPARWRGQASQA